MQTFRRISYNYDQSSRFKIAVALTIAWNYDSQTKWTKVHKLSNVKSQDSSQNLKPMTKSENTA